MLDTNQGMTDGHKKRWGISECCESRLITQRVLLLSLYILDRTSAQELPSVQQRLDEMWPANGTPSRTGSSSRGGRCTLATFKLARHPLAAKRDLELPRAPGTLDHFEVLILGDLGYPKQRADEAEVPSTLIAERHERRSLIVTSDVVFSRWDGVFQSPMATAAAIDRIVHHSVITEFDVPSYRTAAAREEARKPAAQGRRAANKTSRK